MTHKVSFKVYIERDKKYNILQKVDFNEKSEKKINNEKF